MSGKKLQVRMYNVGFGDCFLLTLPNGRKVLIDAGFHSQGKGEFTANELVEQIIGDVTDPDGRPRIDVVVATHRHQDHVYAFNSDRWDDVEVGEVWMPWLEDRQNAKAVKLWKKQKRFAMQLAQAAPNFGLDTVSQESIDFVLWNAGLDVAGVATVGNWSNAGALNCLHEGFGHRDRIKPRFLPTSESFPEAFESEALPGAKIHVLGPPRDASLIEELDPEADGESYRALALRAAIAGASGSKSELPAPFGEAWQVSDDEEGFRLDLTETERMRTLAQGVDAIFAATAIDGMINSTSLVLVLEIGKARLLFPGDAEWGTWKRILDNDDARSLLRGSTFFKVGHHGSHNATSRTLVESVLPRNIPAMMSTQNGPGNYRNNIPLPDLIRALINRGVKCVRSDDLPKRMPRGFKAGPDRKWIDLSVPC